MKSLLLPAALLFTATVFGQEAKKNAKSGQNQYERESRKGAATYNGLTVEEIEVLYPEAIDHTTKNVLFGKNTYRTVKVKTVNTEKLVVILAASLKDQQAEMSQVKEQLEQLKTKSAGK